MLYAAWDGLLQHYCGVHECCSLSMIGAVCCLVLFFVTQVAISIFFVAFFGVALMEVPIENTGCKGTPQPKYLWITQSGAMVFILNLDKVSLKQLFPMMNIQKARVLNIENRKCANVRKRPCTGLWEWSSWLGNSILSNFYLRHLILGLLL